MSQEKETSRQLVEVQDAFTQWRLHDKQPGVRIPEALWDQAVDLVRSFRLSRVATALKLNATELKRRALEAGVTAKDIKARRRSKRQSKKKPAQKFVAIKMADEGPQPSKPVLEVMRSGWHLKLTRQDGAQLELQPPAFDLQQVCVLVESFLAP